MTLTEEIVSDSPVGDLTDKYPEMFFTKMNYSFVGIELIRVKEEIEIPTDQFLKASADFLPILDKLGNRDFKTF